MTVNAKNFPTRQFEANRMRLERMAYRLLGSRSEAEDAVQEAWLRVERADTNAIDNIDSWLTTVVARLCLDMLRARKSRREDSLEDLPGEAIVADSSIVPGATPEDEIAMADSVGLAMQAVMETLTPAERVAFVLHDMFALPFEGIAPVIGRSHDAARKLASRARHRVQGAKSGGKIDPAHRREIIEAFIAASRGGDFSALLSLLDPEVVMRADGVAVRLGGQAELRGAVPVATFFKGNAQSARPATVDGRIDIAVVPRGRLLLVLRLDIADGRIVAIEAVAERDRLERLELRILED